MRSGSKDTIQLPATQRQLSECWHRHSSSMAELEARVTRTWNFLIASIATVIALAVLGCGSLLILHRGDVASLNIRLEERSRDRITSEQVLQLYQLHIEKEHMGHAGSD